MSTSTRTKPYRRDGSDMDLPDGRTCGDCVHIVKCEAMYCHIRADKLCDWSPSRFHAVKASPGNGGA